ncbi:hypothetical protein F5884DRAFT_850140 [Xylogone sp. PMI_703]|nr:hypothetical protein F5884DRAFT_850140 [Xylogone sp. PMI_703]
MARDPAHIPLREPHCLICRYFVEVGETVLALIGDSTALKPVGITQFFEYPSRTRRSKSVVLYLKRRKKRGDLDSGDRPNIRPVERLLCRRTTCLTCWKAPATFLFHRDCFWLAKHELPTLDLTYIWSTRLQSRPWEEESLALWNSVGVPTDALANKWPDGFINLMSKLPIEIRRLVASYCPESPYWKYSAAISWTTENFPKRETRRDIT